MADFHPAGARTPDDCIFAALFLGETRDYYGRFWWWDIALHTTSGLLLGIFGFLLVYVLNGIPRLDLHMRPGFVAFFAFCFALAVGALWEIFEFAMDALLGMNMQKPFLKDPSGLTDTTWDLIVDAFGALVIALSGYLYMKRGVPSPIERWTGSSSQATRRCSGASERFASWSCRCPRQQYFHRRSTPPMQRNRRLTGYDGSLGSLRWRRRDPWADSPTTIRMRSCRGTSHPVR